MFKCVAACSPEKKIVVFFQIDDETRRAVDKITVQRKQFLVEEVILFNLILGDHSNPFKRWEGHSKC